MSEKTSNIVGKGSPSDDLTIGEMRSILVSALAQIERGERVLAIIADKTRDDNTPFLFPIAAEILAERGASKFDALVAQGTHPPMSDAEKLLKIGAKSYSDVPNLGTIFNHHWDKPEELTTIGELSREKVREVTKELFDFPIPLTVNRLLAGKKYDTILIFGGTIPHEVAGFAGGAKYFFPGTAGAELTHATHWLAALASVENIIGQIETPTRHLIEAAADLITAKIISFTSVTTRTAENRLQTHALFAGDFRASLRQAAEISRQVHIKYTGRKYKRIIALLDEHYDDLWVGGKASYRLGAIIETGGELIIYAPHLTCISETHIAAIEKFGGYAPLEIVKKLVAESSEMQSNLCVAAHLTQVAFAGKLDENGGIVPRYKITLASQVDSETCRRVNLNFMDYHNFRLEDYENDSDTLIVERAGRDLYLV